MKERAEPRQSELTQCHAALGLDEDTPGVRLLLDLELVPVSTSSNQPGPAATGRGWARF